MKNRNQHDLVEEKRIVDPVIAVVATAVVGAGAVVAGIVALNNEKNREEVKQVLSDTKDRSVRAFNKVKKEAKDMIQRVEKS